MSMSGMAHVSTREFTIRTGNDGHVQAGRIYTPDPAAVANLKRILAQQAQTRPRRPASQQDAHIAAILQKAKERKRPAQDKPQPKEPKELSMKSKPRVSKWNTSELITAEVVAGWARRIRKGESRNQVAKNNELGVSDYTVRRSLEKYGYDRITGEKVEHEEQQPTQSGNAEQPAAEPTPPETAVAVASSSNGRAVEGAVSMGTGDAVPAINEQMANLRQLLAALPRGKGIKIHGKISIELEF